MLLTNIYSGLKDTFTSTKARIFPRRFSTFLTFWCKIRCNRNEASLYPRLAVAVSTPSRRCIHAQPSLYPRLESQTSLYPHLNSQTPLYPCLTVSIATAPSFFYFLQRSSYILGYITTFDHERVGMRYSLGFFLQSQQILTLLLITLYMPTFYLYGQYLYGSPRDISKEQSHIVMLKYIFEYMIKI